MIIRCWDTKVQSYLTSASKIRSINCSAWPFLYFMFTADGWNFCDTVLSPWTKSTFLFFKILIRCWVTMVQSYRTSAVSWKKRVPAEKCSYRNIKRLICLKQKSLLEKGVPATSTIWPDHRSISTCSSKNSSAEHIHAFLCMSLCVWVCVFVSEWVSERVCL